MSAHANPNIVEDNLVFMYDTINSKSYAGEPTINYIHSQNAVAKDSYTTNFATTDGTYSAKHPNAIRAYNAAGTQLSNYYNSGVTDATNTYHAHWQYDPILKKPVVVMNDIVGGQWKAKWMGTGMGSWASYGKGHGDTYTISWLQWVDNLSKHAKAGLYRRRASDNSNNFWDGQASSASSYNTKLRTWQRVYHTFTTSSVVDLNSTYLSIYMYGHYSPRATVKVADVQFTWGSHPAQFSAEYERTATQALIDRAGNSTIDLSNVSFDSNAQMTFDGTDDYITLPSDVRSIFTSYPNCMECVLKKSSADQGDMVAFDIDITRWNLNYNMYVSNQWSFDFYDGTEHVIAAGNYDDEYVHFVLQQLSDGTMQIYANGVLKGSSAASNLAPNGSSIRIGSRSNGDSRYFNGYIPIMKIYNKSLTSAEVLQNFNATKSRFGL